MPDFCPIKRIDHLELFVGNARQAAMFYETCFGFHRTAYRGLETGSRDSASYVLEQGDIRFVLTTPLGSDHPVANFVHQHGDGVGVVALRGSRCGGRIPRNHQPRRRSRRCADRRGPRRKRRAPHRCDSCLRRHARSSSSSGTTTPGPSHRASSRCRRRRRPAACSRRSITSSATSSWARWRRGSGSLPRRWALPSSSTSTTRPSRPSTRP